MFQYLAPRYDLWNRLASFYLDEYWRRSAVALIPPGSRVLDLCTQVGLAPFEQFDAGPYHYGLIVVKAG